MSTQQPEQPASLADLMELAVAAAHPERAGEKPGDIADYKLPEDRLPSSSCDQGGVGSKPGEIDWSPALKAAYEDGYDPLLWVGRGASAEIWRCVDRSFGREVALKIPRIEQDHDPGSAVDALQDEAELLGRLHHPGIVQAVRRSGEGRSAYLAIDFVDGEEVTEHCRLLDLDGISRLRLFAKVLDAAAYLHSKGIVHGDLKPDHILVREDDQPVMIDFGLSSFDVSANLRFNDALRLGGSGKYRAPEIADNSATTPVPQHDVYSLGIILGELLEGIDLCGRQHAAEEVIARAIETRPEDRWADAGEMLEALRPALAPRVPTENASSHAAESRTKSIHPFRWSIAACLVVTALAGLVWIAIDDLRADASSTEQPNDAQESRTVIQASLFDLALYDIYAGNSDAAQQRIDEIVQEDSGSTRTWEYRHLSSMLAGEGELHPLGLDPYDAQHALCADLDPTTQSIAYVKRANNEYEIWLHEADGTKQMLGSSIEVIRAVAISPGATRVATSDIQGTTVIWTPPINEDQGIDAQQLPRTADDRVIWFGADDQTLFLFSPRARRIEAWPVSAPLPDKPTLLIEGCDHAYLLPSGGGAFMAATSGDHTESGKTQLRLMAPSGEEVIRTLELTDGQLPVSADTLPTETATVCLGMPRGYVRIYDHETGWQPACDLGLNEAVPAVVYSSSEHRIFASLGRVHVIDEGGTLLMRLGNRDAQQQLVTRLHFDEASATLTCLSIQDYWRWVAN